MLKTRSRINERLPEYPQVLFDYVSAHKRLFSDADKEKAFLSTAVHAMLSAQRVIRASDAFKDAADADKPQVLAAGIAAAIASLTTTAPTAPVTAQDIDAALARYKDKLAAELKEDWVPAFSDFAPIVEDLAVLGIRELMTKYPDYLAKSGVVIGGYGDHDYYPSFELYSCYGFLADKLITVREERSRAIERGDYGVIEGFAQDSMIDKFRFGIGIDAYVQVHMATQKALTQVAEKTLAKYLPTTTVSDVQDLINEQLIASQKEWIDTLRQEHFAPLARVITSLPVADLAALAKSLVELQSLRSGLPVIASRSEDPLTWRLSANTMASSGSTASITSSPSLTPDSSRALKRDTKHEQRSTHDNRGDAACGYGRGRIRDE